MAVDEECVGADAAAVASAGDACDVGDVAVGVTLGAVDMEFGKGVVDGIYALAVIALVNDFPDFVVGIIVECGDVHGAVGAFVFIN